MARLGREAAADVARRGSAERLLGRGRRRATVRRRSLRTRSDASSARICSTIRRGERGRLSLLLKISVFLDNLTIRLDLLLHKYYYFKHRKKANKIVKLKNQIPYLSYLNFSRLSRLDLLSEIHLYLPQCYSY